MVVTVFERTKAGDIKPPTIRATGRDLWRAVLRATLWRRVWDYDTQELTTADVGEIISHARRRRVGTVRFRRCRITGPEGIVPESQPPTFVIYHECEFVQDRQDDFYYHRSEGSG